MTEKRFMKRARRTFARDDKLAAVKTVIEQGLLSYRNSNGVRDHYGSRVIGFNATMKFKYLTIG